MEGLLKSVYQKKRLTLALRIVSHTASVLCALLFFLTLIRSALLSPLSALWYALIIGSGYVTVSIARRLINLPRPYEVYDFYSAPPKDRVGLSFPSRHTFLVFAVATGSLPLFPIASASLFLFGILLAISRVLLGIHFIRDVIAGALLGAVSSLIGLLILSPF